MTELTEVASGLTWGEGPRFHEGALWISDTQGSRLWTDASGDWAYTELPTTSNGLWFLPDGTLVGAMMLEGRIGRWTGTEWAEYADLSHLVQGTLGDMIGDAEGNLYVDDLGFKGPHDAVPSHGQILRVGVDGSTSVAAADVAFPNGLAWIDGGSRLVVAQTFAQNLIVFDVAPDGSLVNRQPYADIRALAGEDANPDGIWAGADGIWVATMTGRKVIRIVDGRLAETIETDGLPIACCEDESGRLAVTVTRPTVDKPIFAALAEKAVATRVFLSA